jgi:hypothetical protein
MSLFSASSQHRAARAEFGRLLFNSAAIVRYKHVHFWHPKKPGVATTASREQTLPACMV